MAGLLLILGLAAANSSPANAQKLVKGPEVQVHVVVDGDTVTLKEPVDGATQIRLVGIQAPKLPLGRPGFKKWPLADESKALLEKLANGRKLSLSFGEQRKDRYGRLLAHLHRADGLWIQGELLKQGLARVYSFPDNRSLVAEMLAAEQDARANNRGIWAHPYYAIEPATNLRMEANRFHLVEGVVHDAATVRGRTYLNFDKNWREDFTVSLSPRTTRLFKKEGIDLLSLKGKLVRVRGWLKSFNGPMIDVTHPEQIEYLKP